MPPATPPLQRRSGISSSTRRASSQSTSSPRSANGPAQSSPGATSARRSGSPGTVPAASPSAPGRPRTGTARRSSSPRTRSSTKASWPRASSASAKQKRSRPSTAKRQGLQPKVRTSWRVLAVRRAVGPGRRPHRHRGERPGRRQPEGGPAAVEVLSAGRALRVGPVGPVDVQQVLALDVEHQRPGAAPHVGVLQHQAHEGQGGAGLGGHAADARDRDVPALGAVEEVEVHQHRLAVAREADRQGARHGVLVEGHGPVGAAGPPHRRAGMGGHPALGLHPDHLDLGRADQLAGHDPLGDDRGVGGERRALEAREALGDDAVGRDLTGRVRGGDGHQVVDLQALALAQADLEGLAGGRLVAQHDADGAAHAASSRGSSVARAAARRAARRARRRSPRRWRRRSSRPRTGARFCGARGSRWGRPA